MGSTLWTVACSLALLVVWASAQQSVKVCVPYPFDEGGPGFLEKCDDAVSRANTDLLSFKCVEGGTAQKCAEMVRDNEAQVTKVEGADMFQAHITGDLFPSIVEDLGDGAPAGQYYSVALVKKEFCEGKEPSLADLKGTRSCHTGFRRMAGWIFPFAILAADPSTGFGDSTPEIDGVTDDAELFAGFFSEVCAPRATFEGPRSRGRSWDGLCSSCAGDCSTDDPYYDYSGAFRCLTEDAGDVAFVKHTTVFDFAADGEIDESLREWSTQPKSDFKLLCKEGGCKDVEDFQACNWGLAPGHSVIVAPALKEVPLGDTNALDKVENALLEAGDEFLAASEGLINNFLFSKQIKSIVKSSSFSSPDARTFFRAFTADLDAREKASKTPVDSVNVRVCVPYPIEDGGPDFLERCNAAMAEAATDTVSFECIEGGSAQKCAAMVSEGSAEMTKIEGADMFNAHITVGGIPSIVENFGDGAPAGTYFSVAVVNKEFCDSRPTLASLKGQRSCHTGFRTMAGWYFPFSTLVENVADFQSISPSADGVTDDAERFAEFFSEVCAPRALNTGPATGGGKWDGVCTSCAGDCSTDDPYYDYSGAFRCLSEGSGDVAFVKHTTALDFASDGDADPSKKEWSTRPKSDFRLLCKEGGCKSVEEFETCNFGVAPGHALILAPSLNDLLIGDDTADDVVKAALVDAGEDFVKGAEGLLNNFLFSKETINIQNSDGSFLTAEARASVAVVTETLGGEFGRPLPP